MLLVCSKSTTRASPQSILSVRNGSSRPASGSTPVSKKQTFVCGACRCPDPRPVTCVSSTYFSSLSAYPAPPDGLALEKRRRSHRRGPRLHLQSHQADGECYFLHTGASHANDAIGSPADGCRLSRLRCARSRAQSDSRGQCRYRPARARKEAPSQSHGNSGKTCGT